MERRAIEQHPARRRVDDPAPRARTGRGTRGRGRRPWPRTLTAPGRLTIRQGTPNSPLEASSVERWRFEHGSQFGSRSWPPDRAATCRRSSMRAPAARCRPRSSLVVSDRADAVRAGAGASRRRACASASPAHDGEARADYDARLADVVSPARARLRRARRLDANPDDEVPRPVPRPGRQPASGAARASCPARTRSSERSPRFEHGKRTTTGVMVHLVPDEGVDDGPVLATAVVADPRRRHARHAHRACPRRRARAARRHARRSLPDPQPTHHRS